MDGAIDDGERIVLRPSRGRALRVLPIAVGFVLLGLWILPRAPVVGLLSIVFFGACGLIGLTLLVPGLHALEVGRAGFLVRTPIRRRALTWSEVGAFDVRDVASQSFVVFDRRGAGPQSAWSIANTWLTGANDALPGGYDAHAVAALLNEHRERALRETSEG